LADRVNIVDVVSGYVRLRKSGANFKAPCPLPAHDDKDPSFYVSTTRQTFHCFGCNEGGDVFDFLQQMGPMTFMESVEEVARRAGVDLQPVEMTPEEQQRAGQRNALYDANAAVGEAFRQNLLGPQGAEARAYLQRRELPDDLAERFGIGLALDAWEGTVGELQRRRIPLDVGERAGLVRRRQSGGFFDMFRNRVMIPIRNHRGKVVGFGGRVLSDEEPKYLNSPESPIYDKSSTLFGLGEAAHAIRREEQALIVEGYFDVLSLAAAGVNHAVATCGTALTPNQLRLLKRHTSNVVLVYDGDAAGVRAACRSLSVFLEQGMWPVFAGVPDGLDPDDFVRSEGGDAFRSLLQHAEPLLDRFIHETIRERRGKPMWAERVIEDVAPMLNRAARTMPVTIEPYWTDLADRLRVDEGVVRAHAKGLRQARIEPSAPRAQRATVSLRGSFPAEEWALLKHLLHHPTEAARVIVDREVADMMTSPLRDLVRQAADDVMNGYEPDVLRMLDQTTDDHTRKLLTDLSMSEEMIQQDDVDRMMDELYGNIRRAYLERQRTDARRRARQARDPEEQQQAAADVIRLSRELAALQRRRV